MCKSSTVVASGCPLNRMKDALGQKQKAAHTKSRRNHKGLLGHQPEMGDEDLTPTAGYLLWSHRISFIFTNSTVTETIANREEAVTCVKADRGNLG